MKKVPVLLQQSSSAFVFRTAVLSPQGTTRHSTKMKANMVKKNRCRLGLYFLLVSFILILFSPNLFAKTINLKFASIFSSMHPEHVMVMKPWADAIENETNGDVKIKFLTGGALGKPGQTFDIVAKGIADIGWDISDYTPGRFPLSTVVELPFMASRAEQGSVALWKTYEKHVEMQKEYSDIKLLMLSTHAPGFFATSKKPIASLQDLKGLKIKTASAFTTDALQLFGAVPVVLPVTESYTAVDRGVIDGVVLPFDGIYVYKLHELLKYYTPADFYVLVFWVGMNKDKYNALPDSAKAAIDKYSGLPFSQKCGAAFDISNGQMKELCIKAGMQEVPFSDQENKKLVEMTAPLKDKWVQDMAAKGLPGEAVLKTISEFLGK